jgi:hypothetical protein
VGSDGYRLAAEVGYLPGTVLLEVGSGESTRFLTKVGPTVTIDVVLRPLLAVLPRCRYVRGRAEEILTLWHQPEIGGGDRICFAWLDGHDWPYDDLPSGLYMSQLDEYEEMGLEYSQDASRRSHLTIAQLVAPWVALGGVVAFDDTWRTADGFEGKGGSAVPWLLDFHDRRGPLFELWRVQDDTEPWHNGYVAVRRVR